MWVAKNKGWSFSVQFAEGEANRGRLYHQAQCSPMVTLHQKFRLAAWSDTVGTRSELNNGHVLSPPKWVGKCRWPSNSPPKPSHKRIRGSVSKNGFLKVHEVNQIPCNTDHSGSATPYAPFSSVTSPSLLSFKVSGRAWTGVRGAQVRKHLRMRGGSETETSRYLPQEIAVMLCVSPPSPLPSVNDCGSSACSCLQAFLFL